VLFRSTNDFIEHTENRILKEADLDVFKSHQSANLAASNPFLSLPGGSSPDPTSLATIRTVHIFPASGTPTSWDGTPKHKAISVADGIAHPLIVSELP
jgi:hypothetical protein